MTFCRKDSAGMSVGEALDSIGYRGRRDRGHAKTRCFCGTAHAQGAAAGAENKTIGVSIAGQGIVCMTAKVIGFESHAGHTPMPPAPRALAALAEVTLAVERIAKVHGPNAVGTNGRSRALAAPSAT